MRVGYVLQDSIATITLDDGKRNVLSPEMIAELNAALDRAESDRAVVVLTGREGTFSAGFDMRVLGAGGEQSRALALSGFKLGARVLSFPTPIVVACTGHAIAMGLFLALSADYRIGTLGPHKIVANEVALGITMPFFALELCRQRLAPAYFHRAMMTSEVFEPEEARHAGVFARVVPAAELQEAARLVAARLVTLSAPVYAATKRRAYERSLSAIHDAIEADAASFG